MHKRHKPMPPKRKPVQMHWLQGLLCFRGKPPLGHSAAPPQARSSQMIRILCVLQAPMFTELFIPL